MTPRAQLWCIWMIVPFLVIYLFGFWGLAGFIPPSPPGNSAADTLAFYNANRTAIRAGQLIGIVCSGFFFVWPAAVAAQMARIEGVPLPMFAVMQYVMGAVLGLLFMLCNLIWTVAAYREDMAPGTLQMLHDAGWLIFVMAYPEYIVQLVCIGVVGLSDKRATPWLPRWACYLTFWVAFAGIGGGFATFFKAGPFAWNGLIGFWLPVAFFLIWMVGIILPFTVKAATRQGLEA